MCSFVFYGVYDRHNQLLNLTQKLHLFSDIYFRMDLIMKMAGKIIQPLILEKLGHARRVE